MVRAHAAVVSSMDVPLAVAIAASPAPSAPGAAAPPPAQATAPRIPAVAHPLPPIRGTDLLWLALALLVIVGTGLGIRDPWPADEPRFAALARDMVRTGEWLLPRVGGRIVAARQTPKDRYDIHFPFD